MSDGSYRQFHEKLVPDTQNILGIRMPKLRAYAKELAKNPCILERGNDFYYEEILLRGMVIGYMKTDTETRLQYIAEFVPKINNWAICDSFCSTLKFTRKNRERVWEFLQEYVDSGKEFEQRFGAVMLLDYFVNDAYIDKTLSRLREIHTEQYYSSMAVAWALAECYIKFPDRTKPFLSESCFDVQTLHRAVRKICDSHRVDKAVKKQLKRGELD